MTLPGELYGHRIFVMNWFAPMAYDPFIMLDRDQLHFAGLNCLADVCEYCDNLPNNDPEITAITSASLLRSAKTLRERVFAKHVKFLFIVSDVTKLRITLCVSGMIRQREPGIYMAVIDRPKEINAYTLMKACSKTNLRQTLSVLPFSQPPISENDANDELVPELQDLGNIIAHEATQAFVSAYYPGVPEAHVPEKHIAKVLNAMQREMNREGESRNKQPIVFADLPYNRQRALVERRRFWFAKYGITPRTWKTGHFNLWKVNNEPLTDYLHTILDVPEKVPFSIF